ncbi:hypothetical protein Tco_0972311, partial [Tanacetum coccineum]
ALHLKWRAKVTTIKELKDLSSLALDELIGNLKVHEVIMEKDFEIYKVKMENVKSIALKAKKDSNNDETSSSGSEDKEYAMAVMDFKKFFKRNDNEKTNEETCLIAQSSNEVTLDSSYYSDNASSLDDDAREIEYDNLSEISLKIINKNKILKTKRGLLENKILELNEKIKRLERNKSIDIGCESCQELRLDNDKLKESQAKLVNDASKFIKYKQSTNSLKEMLNAQRIFSHTMKVEELLNVTFDESPPPTKLSPLVDDDVGEEQAIDDQVDLDNNIENETLKDDVVVNIKE